MDRAVVSSLKVRIAANSFGQNGEGERSQRECGIGDGSVETRARKAGRVGELTLARPGGSTTPTTANSDVWVCQGRMEPLVVISVGPTLNSGIHSRTVRRGDLERSVLATQVAELNV